MLDDDWLVNGVLSDGGKCGGGGGLLGKGVILGLSPGQKGTTFARNYFGFCQQCKYPNSAPGFPLGQFELLSGSFRRVAQQSVCPMRVMAH